MEHIRKVDFDVRVEREQRNRAEFDAACGAFKNLCVQISGFIGMPFHGGFDEYALLLESAAFAANPTAGNTFAIAWSGLNELCKYTGSKCGYDQPGWWNACWSEDNNNE